MDGDLTILRWGDWPSPPIYTAFYMDPDDSSSIALAMESVLYCKEARDILIKRGRERVKEFTWDRAAVSMKDLLHDVTPDSPKRSKTSYISDLVKSVRAGVRSAEASSYA